MKELYGERERLPSANTSMPNSYRSAIEGARRWHTKQEEGYLPREEEARLAEIIQAARLEVEERSELRDDLKNAANNEERMVICMQALGDTHEARAALNKLVETHLAYAAYMARASMNILTDSDEVASQNGRRLGAFGDITKLKSPRAVLDDRVQVANMGLVEAAWSYQADVVGKRGKKASFVGYAVWHIHNRLSRHVGGPGEHPTLSLSEAIIKKAREDAKNLSSADPVKQLESLQFIGLDNPLDISEVGDLPAEEASLLEKIEGQGLKGTLDEVLKTLGTPDKDGGPSRAEGVIRLRFGLDDDKPRTLDEIGAVYGITRERVRQIESKSLSQLRHPTRRGVLAPWIEIGGTEKDEDTAYPLAQKIGSRASWQAFEGDNWDDPVRATPEAPGYTDKEIINKIADIIDTRMISAFRRPKQEVARSLYPAGLLGEIHDTIGEHINSEHITAIWNNLLPSIITRAEKKLGGEFSMDRVSQTFSRLLAEYMKDEETVELTIPEWLDGKLNYMGAWLKTGHLKINGNLGSHAGMACNGSSQLTVQGNVGSFVGYGADEYAGVTVLGNAGDYAGAAVRGSANISLTGSVGDYCGYALSSTGAYIEVKGNAGKGVGHQAQYGTIEIEGYAETVDPPRSFKGKIETMATPSV